MRGAFSAGRQTENKGGPYTNEVINMHHSSPSAQTPLQLFFSPSVLLLQVCAARKETTVLAFYQLKFKGTLESHVSKTSFSLLLSPESVKIHKSIAEMRFLGNREVLFGEKYKDERDDK